MKIFFFFSYMFINVYQITYIFIFFQTLLGESLALEAEKALFNLVCFNTDRAIRMKFIEGCLENIQKNKYVLICINFYSF